MPEETTSTETKEAPPAGKVTFTAEQQEEVNRIIQERLGRERTRLEADTQSKYADYDGLKAKAAKWAEHEQAQLTETQKLQQQIAALEGEKATWEAEKTARELEISEELLQAEIKAQAPGFGIPWDVAYHLGDFEDGDRAKAVKKGLEKLVKDRPDLVTASKGPGSPPNEPGKAKPQSQEAVIDSYAEKYLGRKTKV